MVCLKLYPLKGKYVNLKKGAVQKSPFYFVLPSDSEASLASLGTASLLTSFGMTLHEETPRLAPRGDMGACTKTFLKQPRPKSIFLVLNYKIYFLD